MDVARGQPTVTSNMSLEGMAKAKYLNLFSRSNKAEAGTQSDGYYASCGAVELSIIPVLEKQKCLTTIYIGSSTQMNEGIEASSHKHNNSKSFEAV